MAFSKITLNGTTLMDVTQDTVEENNLLSGETATKANGVRTTGTLMLPNEYGIPYEGIDLTVKFADEITNEGGDPWAWIESRITSGDYSGLHIGDYIPFKCTNNAQTQLNARIMGINTYKNSGDTAIGNHIDFWAGLWPTKKPINPANNNNGTSVSSHPWKSCEAYLYANSLQGQVPSTATANPSLVSKNYQTDGIYYFLPSTLKNVIIEKRVMLETRYNSSSLLEDSSSWAWTNIGKIWFPHEVEVYGMTHWSKPGYATGGFVEYPLFVQNKFWVSDYYWLLCPASGSSVRWCGVHRAGTAFFYNASENAAYPVCFRVA